MLLRPENYPGRPGVGLSHEHTGAPADFVHTRNALHQLPDFWKGMALQRIAGLLRPGGILRLHDLVHDFTPAEAPAVLGCWMAGPATDPAAGYTAADYATHLRTEFSTYRWLLEPLLTMDRLRDPRRHRRQDFASYTAAAADAPELSEGLVSVPV